MTKEKLNAQRIGLRADHSIYKLVQDIATKEKKSINRLIIDLIKKNLGEKREKDSEGLVVPSEDKKATECRLPFNASEVVILKQYEKGNSWSVTKEVSIE